MPNLRGWEIFVLIAIVVLLFGSKKLPDAARGIGRSLRIFKAETKGLMDDDKPEEVPAATPTAALPETALGPPAAPVEVESQSQPPPGRTTA